VPTKGDIYTMDHATSVLVTAAAGWHVSPINYHEYAAMALAKLKRSLKLW
jgi:hypothetical protein